MQIDAIHAAVAPLLAGDKGQPFYQGVMSRLRGFLRPFGASKGAGASPEKKQGWFGALWSNATKSPLTPQEASFAATARARLIPKKEP